MLVVRCLVTVLGWVHRIKADLTYVDLDVPPDDAVTVTGARGGRAALRKWRPVCHAALVEKGSISLWRSPDLSPCSYNGDNIEYSFFVSWCCGYRRLVIFITACRLFTGFYSSTRLDGNVHDESQIERRNSTN